jgi:hypothetical protein
MITKTGIYELSVSRTFTASLRLVHRAALPSTLSDSGWDKLHYNNGYFLLAIFRSGEIIYSPDYFATCSITARPNVGSLLCKIGNMPYNKSLFWCMYGYNYQGLQPLRYCNTTGWNIASVGSYHNYTSNCAGLDHPNYHTGVMPYISQADGPWTVASVDAGGRPAAVSGSPNFAGSPFSYPYSHLGFSHRYKYCVVYGAGLYRVNITDPGDVSLYISGTGVADYSAMGEMSNTGVNGGLLCYGKHYSAIDSTVVGNISDLTLNYDGSDPIAYADFNTDLPAPAT